VADVDYAYAAQNVGFEMLLPPSTEFSGTVLNVGFESALPPSTDFSAVAMNVGFEKSPPPYTDFAPIGLNVLGTVGLTRWHQGVRDALHAKGVQLNGSTVPIAVLGYWNASTQKVDPLA
jgi:hypothetical protein